MNSDLFSIKKALEDNLAELDRLNIQEQQVTKQLSDIKNELSKNEEDFYTLIEKLNELESQ